VRYILSQNVAHHRVRTNGKRHHEGEATVNSLLSHADQVLRVADATKITERLGDNANAIWRSWRRCVNEHGLDPASGHRTHVVAAETLAQIRDQLGAYGDIARASMEKLAREHPECGYVILTDASGTILDFVGNVPWHRDSIKAGLVPGANWGEQVAGTNGIGTCIAEQRPVSCHLDDHFHISQLGFSCASMPLFSPEGAFVGVLNVSTMPATSGTGDNGLARAWARQFASLIDCAAFMSHFQKHWVLRIERSTALLEVSHDLLLAIDGDGTVVGANANARQQIGSARGTMPAKAADSSLIGKHLTTIFQCGHGDIWQLMNPQSGQGALRLKVRDETAYFVSATPPRIGKAAPPRVQKSQAPNYAGLNEMASGDTTMTSVLDQARRLVNKSVNILIQGETGTGKEVFARALHNSSVRASKPFVAVNCAAIPESLIESELFGYAAGTFTGARSKGMKGLIERSSGGTLFLDEIGDMPLDLQTRLLRVLSEREVLPLGADKPVPIELTVISATHRNLRKQVADGLFREDLYYRLCGATFGLPPLREREDKEYLIDRLLREEADQVGGDASIDDTAMAALLRYSWPGNVRELRNALRFALAVADEEIVVDDFPPEIRLGQSAISAVSNAPSSPTDAAATGQEPEAGDPAERLQACLRRNKWNITAVSAELGICRTSVYRQMKRFGIVPPTHL